MKEKIHPRYYDEAKVVCSCGNTFTVGATQPTLKVEVCSRCHPFFTGEQRIIDNAGQIERFKKRFKVND
jgi:large subunit ribosomal protein L31